MDRKFVYLNQMYQYKQENGIVVSLFGYYDDEERRVYRGYLKLGDDMLDFIVGSDKELKGEPDVQS